MVLDRRPLYLALFSLTLLAVIAGSGAVMVLVGKGRDVMIFSAGVGVGLSLLAALSLHLRETRWQRFDNQLTAMQAQIAGAVLALQLGKIHPRLMLSAKATPLHASDITLELECRRLLDRIHQLLAKAVEADGHCRYCDQWNAHSSDCPVIASEALYRAGKARRVPWREYKKRLTQDIG